MPDLTDFKKYKFVYLFVILSLVLHFAVRINPLYREVFTDVSVNLPKEVRKTDFSWITVNEWFNTQTHLITSSLILGSVKSDISKNRLKEIISAKRIGASDVIRISIRSNDELIELEHILNEISALYLRHLAKPDRKTGKTRRVKGIDYKKIHDTLYNKHIEIKEKIGLINERLEGYEIKLERLEAEPAQLRETKEGIKRIDAKLAPLKSEYANLKSVYTDNWPSVSKIKRRMDVLEKEKEEFSSKLPAAQKLEDAKSDIKRKINKNKKHIEELRNELKSIDNQLRQARQSEKAVKKEDAPKKEVRNSYIMTPPTQKIFPELGIRLFIASIVGIIFWFLLGRLFKNIYLFWVFKDRLFQKR